MVLAFSPHLGSSNTTILEALDPIAAFTSTTLTWKSPDSLTTFKAGDIWPIYRDYMAFGVFFLPSSVLSSLS